MTLLRDVITIPESVSEGDFVVRASEAADLEHYVVTDQLRESFGDALRTIGHAVTTGRSQAKFLHGSFGSGKSHFMAVLREILKHNPEARKVSGLGEPIAEADSWLTGRKVLSLSLHMLDAQSVEQAVLEGYLNQITALRPDAAPPAVHRSDALLADAARLRARMGDEEFFAGLREGGAPSATGLGLAAQMTRAQGWTAQTYDAAAAALPGTKERDGLVSALTTAYFTGTVRVGEYLDLDTGLQVITRHAKGLEYDAVVLFLDELILWLSTRISDHTFVNTEGAKLNKLVESSDAARPLPLVSFVARQRNLEDFLGPQVGGTEREALAHVMRSVQGRLGEIPLADTNLPEITEKRLLRPGTGVVDKDEARRIIDDAFEAVRGNREVWDTLLSGAQYGDAGIGSDRATFRRLYPFSPALVATLVALSQALQRERTALRVMTELLVARRDVLRVNDLIGVSALFDPLVLHGELPDRPKLKQQFQAARDTYRQKLRPLVLALNGITEEQADGDEGFERDDKLVKTLLLGALVPEVPALHNLTASRLHALNFGSIASPVPGYEPQVVVDRLTKLAADAGELHKTDGPDPVFSLKLSSVDYDKLLDLVSPIETATGVLHQLVKNLVCEGLGLDNPDGAMGELQYLRDWRGRRHQVHVRFGNIGDRDTMPDSSLYADGEAWRLVIDYPFGVQGGRRNDVARIEGLDRGSRTVFWLPYFLTDDLRGRLAQLAKINYLLGSGGGGDRLNSLAADWSVADRQQGKNYLQQRRQQLRSSLSDSLKQAYGVVKPQPSDVETDDVAVLHTLVDGFPLGDPRGGTLKAAFDHLTGELLAWSYPGTPNLPEAEKPLKRAELAKVLHYARLAAADPTHGCPVDSADRPVIQRICNNLKLGELVDHRYVLDSTTCWWSGHLSQRASHLGYTEHFPVHVLREQLDKPRARGFDRDLANLIIAVFAEQQQLAWYERGGLIKVPAVQMITDQMELRRRPMPDEAVWQQAVRRARPLFGKPVQEVCTPAALADFGAIVRGEAAAFAGDAEVLVDELTRHADVLGLDPEARVGRWATARRMARLLRDLSIENDDVVLVGMVADAEVGGIEDITASAAFKQAAEVVEVMSRTNWQLLGAIVRRSAGDERARVIIDELRISAEYEQHVQDLARALKDAERKSTELVAAETSPPPAPVMPKVAETPAPALVTPTVDVSPVPMPVRLSNARDVTDKAEWGLVMAEIDNEVAAGHRVRVTWEVIP